MTDGTAADRRPASRQLEPGEVVAGYQIEAVLPDSGQGTAYRALDTNLHVRVAIKGYAHTDEPLDVDGRERFKEEARMLAGFRHANIVRVRSMFERDGVPYFVMDYEQGHTLRQIIERDGCVCEEELLPVLMDLLSALELVHAMGYVHRDVKPSNVLRRDNGGGAVLLDFGAARENSIFSERELTRVLTPTYAPVEQFMRQPQGASTDIYALGATLYHAVCGKPPTDSLSRKGAMDSSGEDSLTRVAERAAKPYSPGILEAIDRALEIEPDSRPQSVEKLRKIVLRDGWTGHDRRRVVVQRRPTVPSPGVVFQDDLRDQSAGPQMVMIEAGRFVMGTTGDAAAEEGPAETVIIHRGFAVGRYPITYDEYDRFARSTGMTLPADDEAGRGLRPVMYVSWHDAKRYVAWLARETGKPYRLLTEAEWEYAARGGSASRYWWGDEFDGSKVRCKDGVAQLYDTQSLAVGRLEANPFSLYDVLGTVWEWVEDLWHHDYVDRPLDGSVGWVEGGVTGQRVIRGGCATNAVDRVRCAAREPEHEDERTRNLGFRIARDF